MSWDAGAHRVRDLQRKRFISAPFTPLLKRFDDIENKVRFLAGELQKNKVVVVPGSPESFLGLSASGSPNVDLSTIQMIWTPMR